MAEAHRIANQDRERSATGQFTSAPTADVATRLMRRIEFDSSGCWFWTGARNNHGYGQISVEGKHKLTHRVAWTLAVGPIPDGLVIDHLCCSPACCNPDHLEVVTQRENMRRVRWPQPDVCRNGHPFTPENTRVRISDKTGLAGRQCITCRRATANRYARKQRLLDLGSDVCEEWRVREDRPVIDVATGGRV